jgi:hypothetical protein|tara:strand:+ start:517 stop:864 length:348 start_codon:yes stop_codon:yes gene_type:complete
MIKEKTFMYDEDLDRLMIFNDLNEGESVYGSVSIFNLVLDFTTTNRIANVEIRNVSEYLESLDVDPEILSDLSSAKILLKQLRDGFLLTALLQHNGIVERIPFSIPTEKEMTITA